MARKMHQILTISEAKGYPMTLKEFQHEGLPWDELADKGELSAVLDPLGSQRKNQYIHSVHVQILSKALHGRHKGLILDFGCGTGRISRWLVSKGWNVLGVDISTGMLTKAKELTSSPAISILQFDGLRLPFQSNQVDAAVTVYVLQTAMRNPTSLSFIASELHRVLKPNSRLICIEITDKEQLSVGNYVAIITSAGFTVVHDEPVRLRSDRIMTIAQLRFIPKFLIPLLGRLGIWECNRKYILGKMPADWWDHLYIFERT
jgi:SAM-dependent methyltransferase